MVEKLNHRAHILESFEIKDERIYFKLSKERLKQEMEFLRSQGIGKVVSLTEQHHQKEQLQDHFELHHISIEDLAAPEIAQVHQLVDILKSSRKIQQRVA